MAAIERILARMRANPAGIRLAELCRVCAHFFGAPRRRDSRHQVYKMPWPGDPRVNIQNERGNAKPYQVRQVLNAISKRTSDESKNP
jgi:hypothetical protein